MENEDVVNGSTVMPSAAAFAGSADFLSIRNVDSDGFSGRKTIAAGDSNCVVHAGIALFSSLLIEAGSGEIVVPATAALNARLLL